MRVIADQQPGRGSGWSDGVRWVIVALLGWSFALLTRAADPSGTGARPNFVVIYTDDMRADGLGFLGGRVHTPNLDRLAGRSVHFPQAFVVSALCTPSRAQLLSGRYSSQNGVAELPAEKPGDTRRRKTRFNPGEPLLPKLLASTGYFTGAVGKWHIDDTPAACGFQFVRTVYGNGDYYDQTFTGEHGRLYPTTGHVEVANAEFGREFLDRSGADKRPFFLWYNTRAPHMDSRYRWPSEKATRDRHPPESFPLPPTLDGSLEGKPPYLEQSRSRTQALHYGYRDPARVRQHSSDYYSTIAELDAAIGGLLDEIERRGLLESTYIVLMGDNGWFLGEHLFTSKVLAYEHSIRVPLLISGPGISSGVSRQLALNIDIAPTVLELAGADTPEKMYGLSLANAVRHPSTGEGRDAFLYEIAPAADTARSPFIRALRTDRTKLIRTYRMGSEREVEFLEVYDLATDPNETRNLANDPKHAALVDTLNRRLDREIDQVAVKN
jgi:arylsulfatase A-like enzyme